MIKKIAVIGPESTGKSSLCLQLARHFETECCPEFARAYLLQNGVSYQYRDLLHIAKGQLALEDEYLAKLEKFSRPLLEKGGHIPLFIDTDMYVMKIWSEFAFGDCEPFILEQIATRKYDHYLLCNTDLPWAEDELREYPDQATRDQLFSIYLDCMSNQPVPWTLISGTHELRLQKAIEAVEPLLR